MPPKYTEQFRIDDTYCQSIILEYLAKFKSATRADFENAKKEIGIIFPGFIEKLKLEK